MKTQIKQLKRKEIAVASAIIFCGDVNQRAILVSEYNQIVRILQRNKSKLREAYFDNLKQFLERQNDNAKQ